MINIALNRAGETRVGGSVDKGKGVVTFRSCGSDALKEEVLR
jgi:hypothetical protein